jgi:hypothetical protein
MWQVTRNLKCLGEYRREATLRLTRECIQYYTERFYQLEVASFLAYATP